MLRFMLTLGLVFGMTLVRADSGGLDPKQTERLQQIQQQLHERFTAADANHDGKLTAAEAKGKMPRVSEHFSEIDADGRGYVTEEQIGAYVLAKGAELRGQRARRL